MNVLSITTVDKYPEIFNLTDNNLKKLLNNDNQEPISSFLWDIRIIRINLGNNNNNNKRLVTLTTANKQTQTQMSGGGRPKKLTWGSE